MLFYGAPLKTGALFTYLLWFPIKTNVLFIATNSKPVLPKVIVYHFLVTYVLESYPITFTVPSIKYSGSSFQTAYGAGLATKLRHWNRVVPQFWPITTQFTVTALSFINIFCVIVARRLKSIKQNYCSSEQYLWNMVQICQLWTRGTSPSWREFSKVGRVIVHFLESTVMAT